jgi:hypothetical protein
VEIELQKHAIVNFPIKICIFSLIKLHLLFDVNISNILQKVVGFYKTEKINEIEQTKVKLDFSDEIAQSIIIGMCLPFN